MELSDQFRVATTVILGVSMFFNVAFLVFTVRKRVGTRLCTILLRSQSVIDLLLMVSNLIQLQYADLLPPMSQSASNAAWEAYCRLGYCTITYWSLVVMSVYNLMCVSVERCICLCCPFWYRLNKRRLLAVLVAVVAVSPFLMQIPNCLTKFVLLEVYAKRPDYDNGTAGDWVDAPPVKSCLSVFKTQPQIPRGFSITYVVLFWMLPFCLIVVLYLLIVFRIRRSTAMRSASSSAAGSSAARDGGGGSGGGISAAAKKLTITTGLTAIAFIVLFAMDTITFLMKNLGFRPPPIGTPFYEELDSFLLTLNSAVNPLIYIVFLTDFRNFMLCRGIGGGGGGSKEG